MTQDMTTNDLVERLAGHRTLGSAPREELEWLASHGSLLRGAPGDVMGTKGVRVDRMFILLSGRVAIFVDRGAGKQKMMEWQGGDVGGMLPYSRLVKPPGDSVVMEPSEILAVPAELLKDLPRYCPEVTANLVHTMLDRARHFTSSELHDEKMVSLGKLSAGLAHELNNPAAAIERSAGFLGTRLDGLEKAARALGAATLTDAQLAAMDCVRESCMTAPVHGVRSPIEAAEREERIADWLEAHGLDAATAETLSETSVTIESLYRLAESIQRAVLDAPPRRAAARCSLRGLASEIQEASMRISGLVMAVKGFTHMDQAAAAESVNLVRGLDNTVSVLRSKARGKSITVTLQAEPDLPRVQGFAGELNQIWGNLIDNALDAVPESGRIDVTAAREGEHVVVRIVDNGAAGIPAEVRERIFDPFFTTKPMGQGTGLGLDIVRRLVRHNDGQITVESRPGRTEFRVALPLARADGAP